MRIRHGAKALRFKGLKNLLVFQAGECVSDRVLQLWLQVAAHRPGILRIRLRNLKNIHLIRRLAYSSHRPVRVHSGRQARRHRARQESSPYSPFSSRDRYREASSLG